MKVYIVTLEHWENWEILGVYESVDAAMQAHPADWLQRGQRDHWYLAVPYGQACEITPHDVQLVTLPAPDPPPSYPLRKLAGLDEVAGFHDPTDPHK